MKKPILVGILLLLLAAAGFAYNAARPAPRLEVSTPETLSPAGPVDATPLATPEATPIKALPRRKVITRLISSPRFYVPAAIKLETPVMAAQFSAPDGVPIETKVTTGDSPVSRVDFYAMPAGAWASNLPWSGIETAGPQKELLTKAGVFSIGSVTKPPYSMNWKNAVEGKFLVFAVAVDGNGMQQASRPSLVLVGQQQVTPFTSYDSDASISSEPGAAEVSAGAVASPAGLIRLPSATAKNKNLLPYFPRYQLCPNVAETVAFRTSLRADTDKADSILHPHARGRRVLATAPDYKVNLFRPNPEFELASYRTGVAIPESGGGAINYCPQNPKDPWNTPLQVSLTTSVAGVVGKPVKYKYQAVGGTLSHCQYPILVSAPNAVTEGDLFVFSSNVSNPGKKSLRYSWTVSPNEARIINGAGTPTITVDSTGRGGERITAVLELADGSGGPPCTSEASTLILTKEEKPSPEANATVTTGSNNGQWDLSGLAAGVYTAIAEIDDSCGNVAVPVAQVKVLNYCRNDCLEFACPENHTNEHGSSIVFHIMTKPWAVKDSPDDKPEYVWQISPGVIIRGQGTDSIELDTTGLNAGIKVSAQVTVKGLYLSCTNTASLTVPVGSECYEKGQTVAAHAPLLPPDPVRTARNRTNLPGGRSTTTVTEVGDGPPQPNPTPPINPNSDGKEIETIKVKWPVSMEIEQQERIKLSFDRVTGKVTTSSTNGSTTEIFTESGRPLLKDRYGPDYEAFARGELAQVNFQCDGCGKEVFQSLDNPNLEWSWLISPTVAGTQKPAVKLWVEWRHRQNQTKKDAVTVWSKDLTIIVKQPLLTRSTVLLSSGLLGFVGTGFLGGSLLRRLKKAPTIVVAGDVVMGNKGDQYNISGGQIGAVGPDAHVHDVKFNEPDKKT